MTSNLLYVPHHLGLGDAIICNGLVRYLLTIKQTIYIPVLDIYLNSVKFMYRDIDMVRINYIVINSNQPQHLQYNQMYNKIENIRQYAGGQVMCIGFLLNTPQGGGLYQHYVRKFGLSGVYYQPYRLDSEIQYQYYRCDRDEGRQQQLYDHLIHSSQPYIFLHDDQSRNIKIERGQDITALNVISPNVGETDNIFDYGKIIQNASQLHLIDSSFALLADHLNINGIQVKKIYKHLRPQQSIGQTKYINDFSLIW